MTRIKSGFSCRLRRAAAYCKTRRGGGLALSKAVKMGKKSRRQRDKGLSHSEGNKVINPNSVPPFMRGTIAKNNCIRSFFDNVRDGRVGSMAAAPFVTMFESHVARWPRVRPHWRRFRRRLCHFCANSAHLSEPRYLVCSGCGVARYCSEVCQAADWRNHQQECHKHQLAQLDDEIDREWERQGV